MEGQTIGHFEVLERLGGGGMGVVYKARDTKLDRIVALKFLRPNQLSSPDAKRRFVHEAQAASALDHANICTIYAIDETADGQMYLAMRCYAGETLDARIARGPIPVDQAIDIAKQVANGLARAHAAGIVHRDIKPANLMLCDDGVVKILDFGLTKQAGDTRITQVGAILGTVAYMSPEQIRGDDVDARADVWALGVVLHEMLTGQLPFRGASDAVLMHAIRESTPALPSANNKRIPPEVDAIVARALARDPSRRYASGVELLAALEQVGEPTGQMARYGTRWKLRTFGLAATLVAAAIAVWFWGHDTEGRQLQEQKAIASIIEAINADNFDTAYLLARDVERVDPNNPLLGELLPQFSVQGEITSDPVGAEVWMRPYASSEEEEILIGTTPIDAARAPPTTWRYRFVKEGYRTIEFASRLPEQFSLSLSLLQDGTFDSCVIRIPAGRYSVNLFSYPTGMTIQLEDFAIDRFEVTNAEFAEFIADGGYANAEHWSALMASLGPDVSFESAIDSFRNENRRFGPSTWNEGSSFPPGEDNHPVTGVSYWEAAAYAHWAGRDLPTFYQWVAVSGTTMAASILTLSNFSPAGTIPVGESGAIGPYGTYDMAGNAREWVVNPIEGQDGRFILGGAYGDANHKFMHVDARSPYDRDAGNGFRTVINLGPNALASIAAPVPVGYRRPEGQEPVSAEAFAQIRREFEYDPQPLDAETVSPRDNLSPGIDIEQVTFSGSQPGERMPAYLFLPSDVPGPHQAIVYMDGAGILTGRPSQGQVPYFPEKYPWIRSWILSGRAVVVPVIHGTFERSEGDYGWPEASAGYKDWVVHGVQDLMRTADFLSDRPDIDADRIAFAGFSWGATRGVYVLALDQRYRTGVLLSGGVTDGEFRTEVDPLNFAPYVDNPVLMLNGRGDYNLPEPTQVRLFDLLGGKEAGNRYVAYEAEHSFAFRMPQQVRIETLDWWDLQLGKVE